jgi:hypothetical protein
MMRKHTNIRALSRIQTSNPSVLFDVSTDVVRGISLLLSFKRKKVTMAAKKETNEQSNGRLCKYNVIVQLNILQYNEITINSRDSSVGIALGYGLNDRSSRVRFPAGAGNFSLHHRVQNGSEAHPASYPMGTRGSFPAGKAAGA